VLTQMKKSTFILIGLIIFSTLARADSGPPAAAVASAHPLATAAGEEILKKGGNAFDAAIAVSAALGVVEPAGSGFGGGGFWLLHRARDGKQVLLDARETAPALAHERMYQDEQGNVIKEASINGPPGHSLCEKRLFCNAALPKGDPLASAGFGRV